MVDRIEAVHERRGWARGPSGARVGARSGGSWGSWVCPPALARAGGHAERARRGRLAALGRRWGLGIATEAAARVGALRASRDRSCPGSHLVTVPPEPGVQAVMQRIGMRYDGVFHHPLAAPEDWWGPHVLSTRDGGRPGRRVRTGDGRAGGVR